MKHPVQVVIFGASGDLSARKLIPALCENALRRAFAAPVQVVGVSRSPLTSEAWREQLYEWLDERQRSVWHELAPNIHYVAADASDATSIEALEATLVELAGPWAAVAGRLYYLALKPTLFAPTIEALSAAGMLQCDPLRDEAWRRVVVEKPFGRDLATAQWLNIVLGKHLREDQIYRIDHYLGKETVQNILAFRFQNAIWEPLWNRQHIETVQINVCESVTVGDRGGYYDTSGALRDMVQNHIMQLLALVAMEAPTSMDAEAVRSEKVKVLRALVPLGAAEDVWQSVVRGQYVGDGTKENGSQNGYLDEAGVPSDSRTETFIAVRAQIHNWRWNGVPFLLRTGKAMRSRYSEIVIRFRAPPADIFGGPQQADVCRLRPNELVIRIQPDEGMRIRFLVKQPGPGAVMRQTSLGFDYSDTFSERSPDAYERLLLDAIEGNATLFIRGDEAEASWRFCDAISAGFVAPDAPSPSPYSVGSTGPHEADALFQGCEGTWSHDDD